MYDILIANKWISIDIYSTLLITIQVTMLSHLESLHDLRSISKYIQDSNVHSKTILDLLHLPPPFFSALTCPGLSGSCSHVPCP